MLGFKSIHVGKEVPGDCHWLGCAAIRLELWNSLDGYAMEIGRVRDWTLRAAGLFAAASLHDRLVDVWLPVSSTGKPCKYT